MATATADELAEQFAALAALAAEERKEAMEKLPAERKFLLQQYNQKVARGMADINMVLKLLKPLDESPDEPVPTMAVLASLACCPGMSPIGGEAEPDPLQKIEAAFMEHALETDANAYKDVHDKIPPAARSTLLLLLYLLYQAKFHESGFELEGDLDERCEIASQVAIRILVQCQRAIVETRWVQPTLALYRTSALLGNGLWSGSDLTCVKRMRAILAADDLAYPDVSLRVHVHAGLTVGGDPERVPFLSMDEFAAKPVGRLLPGKPVYLEVELTRKHAQDALDGQPVLSLATDSSAGKGGEGASNAERTAAAARSVVEAYWLVVEGLKDDPEPNAMVHHQPMTVTSVATESVRARTRFAAPPPGSYTLRVHVLSSSVAGIALLKDVDFVVEEDDVPELS